jgi:hypothetical protein
MTFFSPEGSLSVQYEQRKAWIDLWTAVFGEPPPVEPDPELAAPILVEHLPPAPPYLIRSRTE